MEWLMRLQGQVVGLDTAPLIYFIEQNEAYLTLVRSFFQAMSRGEFPSGNVNVNADGSFGASATIGQSSTG